MTNGKNLSEIIFTSKLSSERRSSCPQRWSPGRTWVHNNKGPLQLGRHGDPAPCPDWYHWHHWLNTIRMKTGIFRRGGHFASPFDPWPRLRYCTWKKCFLPSIYSLLSWRRRLKKNLLTQRLSLVCMCFLSLVWQYMPYVPTCWTHHASIFSSKRTKIFQ